MYSSLQIFYEAEAEKLNQLRAKHGISDAIHNEVSY